MWKYPLLLFISVVAGLTQMGLPSLRPGVVFVFLLLCPGSAFIGLLELKNPFIYWMLSIALSLALVALVSQFITLTGILPLQTGFWILDGVSIVALGWQTWHHYSQLRIQKSS